MKTGKTLVELAREIERQRGARQDFLADTGHVRMEATPSGLVLDLDHQWRPVRDLAHQQIAERIGIPSRYYTRMRGEAPDLLVRNVNHWFREQPERRMIRTLDGDVRAFLSDRYQRIDNAEVAETVLPVLADVPDVDIVSSEITESRLYIKAVTQAVRAEVRVGDRVQAGVMITNSEVGLGAITVTPLVYRLVCQNGMVVPDTRYRRNHVGRRAAEDDPIYELLSDETRRADDHAILLKVRDVVKAALSETVFGRTVAKLRGAASERIIGDPAKAIQVLADKVGLNDQERGGVLRHLIEGADLSRYGIIQAVTRFAHEPEDYDRATELETIGGRILDLPRTNWEEIRKAA